MCSSSPQCATAAAAVAAVAALCCGNRRRRLDSSTLFALLPFFIAFLRARDLKELLTSKNTSTKSISGKSQLLSYDPKRLMI